MYSLLTQLDQNWEHGKKPLSYCNRNAIHIQNHIATPRTCSDVHVVSLFSLKVDRKVDSSFLPTHILSFTRPAAKSAINDQQLCTICVMYVQLLLWHYSQLIWRLLSSEFSFSLPRSREHTHAHEHTNIHTHMHRVNNSPQSRQELHRHRNCMGRST